MLFLLVGCTRPAPLEQLASRFVSEPTLTPAPAEDTLFVIGSFTGESESRLLELLDQFTEETGIRTVYRGNGEVAELLRQSIEAGQTPDVILVPKINWLHELASAGAIVPLAPKVGQGVQANFTGVWQQEVAHEGVLYGVPFDANLKSLLWHPAAELYSVPDNFDDLRGENFTLTGGADWVLTDWFENVLLATAGTEVYDGLMRHEIEWTDMRVITAARTYTSLLQPDRILGGTEGYTLPLDESAFERTFIDNRGSLRLWMGQSSIFTSYAEKTGYSGYTFSPFPNNGTYIVIGSTAVGTNQRPETNEFLYYLTQPHSVQDWVRAGGFISPNIYIGPAHYPGSESGAAWGEAEYLANAPALRGDLSDQLPPHLSAFLGQQLRELLLRPDEVLTIMSEIEAVATREQGRVPEP